MASIKVDGVTLVLQENDKKLLGMDDLMRKMLKSGAEILIKSQREHLQDAIIGYTPKERGRRNGTLKQSIEAGHIIKTPESAHIDVWPHGEREDQWHKKPARNAQIGFVVNYGKRNMHGRPFVKQSIADSESEVNRRWEEMLNEYMANG